MKADARPGLALIIVVGILGVLAALAASFVVMAQLERRASEQRVNAARAYLLARSGIEDALARLDAGQDPDAPENRYGGEDWDASGGALNAFEAAQEVFDRGAANVEDCPVRHAMRPSFPVMAGTDPRLLDVQGRKRGYSGRLAGDHAVEGNTYAVRAQSSNNAIDVNGGALDALDRDPDGPNGMPETAPLLPNGTPDHRDASMEGPNGFLVRLLNNLDAVVTDGASAGLGAEIVRNRPVGGYRTLDDLKPILGSARHNRFRPYLTTAAWADPTVVKPQPMDGRPQRWEDIDDAHRAGTDAVEISGVHHDASAGTYYNHPLHVHSTTGTNLSLDLKISSGNGREDGSLPALSSDGPWTQMITATNYQEGTVTYPVRWERNFVYAWSQLRPAPLAFEPRAPISVNGASKDVLAAAFLGLKGVWLETWDGSAGWDGGFSWAAATVPPPAMGAYPYPDRATDETPWHRTRIDYGMTYGQATEGSRPWFGGSYDPHHLHDSKDPGGKPVILCAPLGRLKETLPVSRAQAAAIADQARSWISQLGPFRTWERFNAFVDLLPAWEDLNDDGILDGLPYPVVGDGGAYTRSIYRGEDFDSDGVMTRETFTAVPGTSWGMATLTWIDPHLGRAALEAAGQAPGLTRPQKALVMAMANPNTDLNNFNPDANLWKEIDKTDAAGMAPDGYAHTTEFTLAGQDGIVSIRASGRILAPGGRLRAHRQLGLLTRLAGMFRNTTQADFMRSYREGNPAGSLFLGSPAPYGLAGGQALVSYPEPQTTGENRGAGAAYDGRIGLGFISVPARNDETLRGDLFDTRDADATGDAAVPDLRGPSQGPLLQPAGGDTGNVFPDGVYSEKDRTLMFPMEGNLPREGYFEGDWHAGGPYHVGFWVKPNWPPEASPRAHALLSLSPGGGGFYAGIPGGIPLAEIGMRPHGLYFAPGRNVFYEDQMRAYLHAPASTRGMAWPRRTLIWGSWHHMAVTETLNRRAIERPLLTKPVGRFEARRWQYMAVSNNRPLMVGARVYQPTLGTLGGDVGGPTWHSDGTPNMLRFGEVAGLPNMNDVADATFAGIAVWGASGLPSGPSSPAARGRYFKEAEAAYASPPLPAGLRPLSITWTEIPCDLWFDEDGDGWLGDPPVILQGGGITPENALRNTNTTNAIRTLQNARANPDVYRSRNDRDGNGLRDVHIEMEVRDDRGLLARFRDATGDNRIPRPQGRLFYKAVFVNEWDADIRSNYPLDVTPFLDDVTIVYQDPAGIRVLAWESAEESP